MNDAGQRLGARPEGGEPAGALEGAPAPVLFEELPAAGGRRIGVATLNAPKTLNGLSLEMTRLLDARLRAWIDDPALTCIVLQGAGEKAFCAGGDLHGLYRSMREHRASGSTDILSNRYAVAFFEEEYRLDYRIHLCAKPILCWGDGIVMGGGIGLMSGCSHRVVTERSKLAMPEVGIGLFPDVGGSWLLRRVPQHGGLFLALTGASLNASDAIHAGFADVCLDSGARDVLFDRLLGHHWSGDAATDRRDLGELLAAMAQPSAPGPLQRHVAVIARCFGSGDLEASVAAIRALDDVEPWLVKAKAALAAGSPGAARLAWELQHRDITRELADAFRTELVVALHAAAHGDFAEGIRALLIDKDRQPRWNPASLGDADTTWADRFFDAPWGLHRHPLRDLDLSMEEAGQ